MVMAFAEPANIAPAAKATAAPRSVRVRKSDAFPIALPSPRATRGYVLRAHEAHVSDRPDTVHAICCQFSENKRARSGGDRPNMRMPTHAMMSRVRSAIARLRPNHRHKCDLRPCGAD